MEKIKKNFQYFGLLISLVLGVILGVLLKEKAILFLIMWKNISYFYIILYFI